MAKTLKTIVIGTSLTDVSDGVVRTGASIARATGASPWLIHVYAPPVYAPELGNLDPEWPEQQAGILREKLAQQARRTALADLAGFKPDRLLPVMSSPLREVVDVARRVAADLIVVGAAEGGALRRMLLGSTADAVIRKAPCPVLVVRSESAFPPCRVEVPVDLSPVSASAFHQGLELLSQLGAALTETEVLFVLNPFEVGGSGQFTPAQIERFASEELQRFIAANNPGTLPGLTQVRIGYVREEILNVLKERQADLAILGTHGRSGLERLTVGSVAFGVMHQAGCNLLLIPPGAIPERKATVREKELRGADWTYVSDEDEVLTSVS